MEWPNASSPAGLFAGRDMPRVGSTFGEAFLYYNAYNPVVGAPGGKVAFVKRVLAQGVPVLIGSGYYPGESAGGSGSMPPTEEVEVSVGTSGETVTLRTTAGGYTLEGEPVSSGYIYVAGSGARYRLTLENGTWTATLVQTDGGTGGADTGASWTNSLGMEFVRIPAGSFLMGSPEDEEGRWPREGRSTRCGSAGGSGWGSTR